MFILKSCLFCNEKCRDNMKIISFAKAISPTISKSIGFCMVPLGFFNFLWVFRRLPSFLFGFHERSLSIHWVFFTFPLGSHRFSCVLFSPYAFLQLSVHFLWAFPNACCRFLCFFNKPWGKLRRADPELPEVISSRLVGNHKGGGLWALGVDWFSQCSVWRRGTKGVSWALRSDFVIFKQKL